MTRTSIFIIGLGAALSIPGVASANCGTMQGSYAVTCERGVQVYRHQALSGVPAPITQAEAYLESAKLRADTAEKRIAAEDRASKRDADLRNRELGIEDYRARIYDRNSSRRSYRGNSYGNNSYGSRFNSGQYGSGGYSYGQPVRVRTQGLKSKG